MVVLNVMAGRPYSITPGLMIITVMVIIIMIIISGANLRKREGKGFIRVKSFARKEKTSVF